MNGGRQVCTQRKMSRRRYTATLCLVLLGCGASISAIYAATYYALVRRSFGIAVGVGPWPAIAKYRLGGDLAAQFYSPIHSLDRRIRDVYWRDFVDADDLAARGF